MNCTNVHSAFLQTQLLDMLRTQPQPVVPHRFRASQFTSVNMLPEATGWTGEALNDAMTGAMNGLTAALAIVVPYYFYCKLDMCGKGLRQGFKNPCLRNHEQCKQLLGIMKDASKDGPKTAPQLLDYLREKNPDIYTELTSPAEEPRDFALEWREGRRACKDFALAIFLRAIMAGGAVGSVMGPMTQPGVGYNGNKMAEGAKDGAQWGAGTGAVAGVTYYNVCARNKCKDIMKDMVGSSHADQFIKDYKKMCMARVWGLILAGLIGGFIGGLVKSIPLVSALAPLDEWTLAPMMAVTRRCDLRLPSPHETAMRARRRKHYSTFLASAHAETL